MNIVVGGVPRDDDFFDREALIAELLETLRTGSVMLVGPRRSGKTAIMNKLVDDQMEYPEVSIVYKNCQPLREPEQFWAMIEAEIELRQVKEEEYLVIELDEFPSLLEAIFRKEKMEGVGAFLARFRDLRQDPERGRSLRFVLAGSTSVDIFLRDVGFNLMNDLRRIIVSSFEESVANEFIGRCFQDSGITISRDSELTRDIIAKLSGYVPFFMQLFLSEIRFAARGKTELTLEDLYEIYWDKVLGGTGMRHFSYFYQRIDKYRVYGKKIPDSIRKILSILAVEGKMKAKKIRKILNLQLGSVDDRKTDIIMANLQDDFYLKFDPGKRQYGFLYTIMRDWWRKYYPPTLNGKVTEVYLINGDDGILMCHTAHLPQIRGDADTTAGMLTGVLNLMEDLGYGIPREIPTVKGTFLVVSGERFILAGMMLGPTDPKIKDTFVKKGKEIEEMGIPDPGCLSVETKDSLHQVLNGMLGEH